MTVSNLHLLDNCVMLRQKPVIYQGVDIYSIHTLVRSILVEGQKEPFEFEGDAFFDTTYFEPFCSGGRLEDISFIELMAVYPGKPRSPIYPSGVAKVVRKDFYDAFSDSFDTSAQIFDCAYLSASGKPRIEQKYRYAHILHRYYFNSLMDEDRLIQQDTGTFRFHEAVSQRGDLQYEGFDFFINELAALPDLFFLGNYLDLSFPVIKKSALPKLEPFNNEFDIIEVPLADVNDDDITILEPFTSPIPRPFGT